MREYTDVELTAGVRVVPWSGEIIAPPVLDPPPTQIPTGEPDPRIPERSPSLIPVIVHGVKYAWGDVSTWVNTTFRGLFGGMENTAVAVFQDVINITEAGLAVERTAWSSFISSLEGWIETSVSALTQTIQAVSYWTMLELLQTTSAMLQGSESMVSFILQTEAQTITRELAMEHALMTYTDAQVLHALDYVKTTWVTPLLIELGRVGVQLETEQQRILSTAEQYTRDQVNVERLARVAAIAALAKKVATVATYVDECGAPMCEAMGPKTDWFKLLKLLNIAGMLALLTTVGTLTEAELESLGATVASLGAGPASAFVDAFVSKGDTLATAIADTVPQLGF